MKRATKKPRKQSFGKKTLEVKHRLWRKPYVRWKDQKGKLHRVLLISEAREWALANGYKGIKVVNTS